VGLGKDRGEQTTKRHGIDGCIDLDLSTTG
jgi:hypothetical protein